MLLIKARLTHLLIGGLTLRMLVS